MKVRITVGAVDVRIEGINLTLAQTRRLMIEAGALAAKITEQPDPLPPIGFAAPVLERLPDDLADEPGGE